MTRHTRLPASAGRTDPWAAHDLHAREIRRIEAMRESFLIAEGYGQLVCQFACEAIPGHVPAVKTGNGSNCDPLRLRPITDFVSTIEQLMQLVTDIPVEWRLGEYWTYNTSDLATSRALNSKNVREALDVMRQNQLLLSNVRSISHTSSTDDDLILKYYSECKIDPIVKFLFQSLAATKICHFLIHILPQERFAAIDKRADCFGSLIRRLGDEFDFIEVEFEETELSLKFYRHVLDQKVAEVDRRLIKAVDRELSRRASDVFVSGRWKDRIKYHMQTNSLVNISLDEISRHFGIQRRTLSRQLQNEGTTFTNILRDLRRERAIYLVRYTKIPLKRVATELGFNSDASFNLAFKSWTGITPMKYRKSVLPS